MSRIVKFCHEEHNIGRNGTSIRVGTLYGFRHIEDPLLADAEEGIIRYEIGANTVTFSSADFTAYTGGLIRSTEEVDEEAVRIFAPTLAIGGPIEFWQDEKGSWVSASNIDVVQEIDNVLIFCASYMDKFSYGGVADYDSAYSIDESQAEKMAEGIAEGIYHHLVESYWTLGPFTKDYVARSLKIDRRWNQVIYEDKLAEIKSAEDWKDLDSRMLNDMAVFRKPVKFSKEKEFRFVFRVRIDNMAWRPQPKYSIFVPREYVTKRLRVFAHPRRTAK